MNSVSKSASSPGHSIFKNAFVITGMTLISRVLGAVRDLVLTHVFGATGILDAFILAFTIPNVFRRLTAEGSMTLAFIPIYSEVREQEGHAAARVFAQRVLSLTLWVTILLSVLGIIFSRPLVTLFAAGFLGDADKYDLTVSLTCWMFPYLIFISVVAWAMGVLNAEKRFAAPAAAPIFLNICMIGSALWLAPQMDVPIYAIAIGVLAGGMIQLLVQVPSLRRIGQSLQPRSMERDPRVQELIRLLLPSLLGVAVYQVNIIILRNIASFLPSGQVTYYYTANRLTELAIGLFAFAITTASFPTLSDDAAKKDWNNALETLRLSFTTTLLIVVPAMAGLVAFAQPIVTMLFYHGAFSLQDVKMTALTLQAFALGMPAIASIRQLVSVFYAMKDTKTPVLISIFSIVVTGLAGWGLSRSYEVVGLAMGLSVGTWFQFFCLFIALTWQKKVSAKWLDRKAILKYLLAGSLMGLVVMNLHPMHSWTEGYRSIANWGVFVGILFAAAVIYFGSLLILKDSYLSKLLLLFKNKLPFKRS